MRQRFPELIQTGLHNGLQLERIEVKMPRTIMKPFYDRWLIELNNTMTTDRGKGKEAIISGQKEASECDATEIVSSKLPSLDPFNDILANGECRF